MQISLTTIIIIILLIIIIYLYYFNNKDIQCFDMDSFIKMSKYFNDNIEREFLERFDNYGISSVELKYFEDKKIKSIKIIKR